MSAVHKNEWYINEHVVTVVSNTGAELPEGNEHTNLLRIGDIFRWLGEVGNVCNADTPFKCWSPKMNCNEGSLSQSLRCDNVLNASSNRYIYYILV